MADPNLVLNILTFNHPKKNGTFNVFDEDAPGLVRFHRSKLPEEIEKIFPYNEDDDNKFLYLDVLSDPENKKIITVDLEKNVHFAKHYYTWLIQNYFGNVAHVTQSNFVKDIDVWFLDKKSEFPDMISYKTYSLRVQIQRISKLPELVISYNGTKLVHKKSVLSLDIETQKYNWVVYKNKLHKYRHLPKEAKEDYENVFPVMSLSLKTELEVVIPFARNANKYKNYMVHIRNFIDNYLNTPDFLKIIPLTGTDFLKVEQSEINNTSPGSNMLQFGKNLTNRVPMNGLKAGGPYGHCPHDHINIFCICPQNLTKKAVTLFNHFKVGMGDIPPLYKLVNKPLNINKNTSITFIDTLNPLPEIMAEISSRSYEQNTHYLAVYISPYNKNEQDQALKDIYYKLKQNLLKYRISSQVVYAGNIESDSFRYHYINICIAILAKLGGVPWRLKRENHNELVIGVGAFKSLVSGVRYIGGAFCFSNDGRFHNFECFSEERSYMLAGPIAKAINQFKDQFTNIKRVVIHYYKQMSDEEIKPITKILHSLGLDIPVVIITINKTESNDYVIFDTNFPEIIPLSGTFISIGNDQYLLCNNTRYSDTPPSTTDGFPFPIKLTIKSASNGTLISQNDKHQLIDQVYQFSRMYWKSVRQQNMPVTIKYPEMVASFVPFFPNNTIPDFGKNNLWFL